MNCAICGSKIVGDSYRVYYEGAADICTNCYQHNENWVEIIYCDNCGGSMPDGDHYYVEEEYDPNRLHQGRIYCDDCYDAIVSIFKRESSQDYFIDA